MKKCEKCNAEYKDGESHTCAPVKKSPDTDPVVALGNAITDLRKKFEDSQPDAVKRSDFDKALGDLRAEWVDIKKLLGGTKAEDCNCPTCKVLSFLP